MDKIVIIPLIISAVLLTRRSPKEVFVLVFLPSLTLLPTYYSTELVKGTPELYFYTAAILPVLAVWAYRGGESYSFHWMDAVVLAYILMVFYGQLVNSDYKKAQKVLFNNMMGISIPYIMVKSFCKDQETMIKLLLMMTVLGAIVAFVNMWEFRMFINIFDEYLRRIWPGSVMWDSGFVMTRWGFKRAFGPFSHPIVAGYVFSLIAPISIWCYFHKHYTNRNFGRVVVCLNAIGVMISISRAPMMGFIFGLMIIIYGWSRNKAVILSVMSIVLAVALMLAIPKFIMYMSVTRSTAETPDQRNIAYRKEMWESYVEVAMERPYVGWGRFSVPSVRGMKSIDSEYLGVALSSGIVALCLYLVFLLGMLIRMLHYVFGRGYDDPWACLVWCIVAGWTSAIFSQATVYSGAQSVQYLFMLGGIGHTIIIASQKGLLSEKSQVDDIPLIDHRFNFKRTL